MKTETPSIVCGKIRFRNFKRIEFFEADLAGNHLLISGPNGSGKTSIVDALLSMLGLAKGRDIPEPIRRGASKAELCIELIDQITGDVRYHLRQAWNGRTKTYTVHDADGKPVPIREFQQQIDAQLVNPVEFIHMRPQDQLDEVLRIFGITPPVDAVREITGETHLPRDGETAADYLDRLSTDETGLYYDRRRIANRALTQKRAALEDAQKNTQHFTPIPTSLKISELQEKRNAMEKVQHRRREAEYAAEDSRRKAESVSQSLESRKTSLAAAERAAEALRKQLREKEKEISDLQGQVLTWTKAIADAEVDYLAKQREFLDIPDQTHAIGCVDADIRQAEVNAKREAAQNAAVANVQRLVEEVDLAVEDFQRSETVLAKLRELRKRLLTDIDLGVPGLEVGTDYQLRINGAPFSQASLAESIDAACAVAFRRRPGARIAVIDNGEHLDSTYRQRVIQRASEHGCQLCLTVVRDVDGLEWELAETLPAHDEIAAG